ncbi:hypothetical protein N7486_003214 [Penicillium sp. IBT 16267x]|nr:hypothetical protein N7486_003214 [Penicillium sp. IBT 16267x]
MHLAEYLFHRIHQINIRSVFGVPGDFNLTALDYGEECGPHWVGNVNELNAGKKLPVHHTLADGDYDLFMKMSERVSAAAIMLKDPLKATKMIDETIIECYRSSKPVYIGFPMDLVKAEIDPSPLENLLLLRSLPTSPTAEEETLVKTVRERLYKTQSPVIIVDSLAGRYEGLHVTRTFVEKSNLPCFAFPMAKGIINESLPNFRGIYAGDVSNPGVQKAIKSNDLILLIGPRPSDLNTGAFKSDVPDVDTIVFQRDTVQLAEETYSNISMANVLGKLSDAISVSASHTASNFPPSSPLSSPASSVGANTPYVSLDESSQVFKGNEIDKISGSIVLSQEWMWQRISSWLDEDDIIAMDVGSSAFVGAAIAAREQFKESETKRKRRTPLVRQELGVIIFVIGNDGYTIERFIHGVRTRGELEALLTDDQFGPAGNFNEEQPEPLRLVEVYMDKHDAPQTIPDMINAIHGKLAT